MTVLVPWIVRRLCLRAHPVHTRTLAHLHACALVPPLWQLGSLVALGGQLDLSAGVDRSVVESYFACNSASFFVGWA